MTGPKKGISKLTFRAHSIYYVHSILDQMAHFELMNSAQKRDGDTQTGGSVYQSGWDFSIFQIQYKSFTAGFKKGGFVSSSKLSRWWMERLFTQSWYIELLSTYFFAHSDVMRWRRFISRYKLQCENILSQGGNSSHLVV